MTIQQFIEKAIEGGSDLCGRYQNAEGLGYPKWQYNTELRRVDFVQITLGFAASPTRSTFHIDLATLLLDPEAWKAVAKAEALSTPFGYMKDVQDSWAKNMMHRMIDALAEGKSIEEFLTTL